MWDFDCDGHHADVCCWMLSPVKAIGITFASASSWCVYRLFQRAFNTISKAMLYKRMQNRTWLSIARSTATAHKQGENIAPTTRLKCPSLVERMRLPLSISPGSHSPTPLRPRSFSEHTMTQYGISHTFACVHNTPPHVANNFEYAKLR